MKRTSSLLILLAMVCVAGCVRQPTPNTQTAPTPPSGPAAAVQPHTYYGVGVVKGLNFKTSAIEIDHEEIVGLMPAMQMEFAVTDGALLSGLAVNDRIDFTVVEKTGQMAVTAIQKKN